MLPIVPESIRKWVLKRPKFKNVELLCKSWLPLNEEPSSLLSNEALYFCYDQPLEGIPVYTTEDYQKYLQDEDWSENETTYLLELAKAFQLNFIIMQDRYLYQDSKKRSVEELKDRYNNICKNLPGYQCFTDEGYEMEFERKRKAELEEMYHQSQEYVDKDTELKRCVSGIIDSYSEFIQERHRKICTFAGDLYAYIDGIIQADKIQIPGMTKRREAEPIGGGSKENGGESIMMRSRELDEKQNGKHRGAIDLTTATPSTTKREKIYIGPFLRSSKFKSVRSGTAKHVEKFIIEYGLPIKPTIPTIEICRKYDELKRHIEKLIESRKVVDKLELELKTSSERKNTNKAAATK